MCVKFGTKSTHFAKKKKFPKCVNIGYIYALWKIFENQILHGLLYFSFSKTKFYWFWKRILNVLSTILFIVRSFVKVLKLYRWDKGGLYHAFCIDFVSIFLPHFKAIFFYIFRIFLDINLPRWECCFYNTFGNPLEDKLGVFSIVYICL